MKSCTETSCLTVQTGLDVKQNTYKGGGEVGQSSGGEKGMVGGLANSKDVSDRHHDQGNSSKDNI